MINITFINDNIIKLYRDCDDVEVLRKALLDMRNEIIRLRILNEKLRSV